MPRILFVAAHRPDRSPSQRFRFEQYLGFLKENGYDYDFSFLINERDDNAFYLPGNFTDKARIFLRSWFHRLGDILRARDYDIIFVQREAFMTGSAFFEKIFSKSGAKLVFDFDDAIWHYDVSPANRHLGWLKSPAKTARIIKMSHHIIAGNNYLADYARQYNANVTVIPTTIDTERHKPLLLRDLNPDRICIGWTGSHTTVRHFRLAEPVLAKMKSKYGDKVWFKLIGDAAYKNDALDLKGTAWSLSREVEDLRDLTIGIMPLPDDEWSKGKCGFKGLQYMAMSVPPVMSPVGVNTEIVNDGVNGFLASTEEEWVDRLSLLAESPELRVKMGEAARQTVISRYSVESQKPVYLRLFNDLISS